MQDDDFAPFSHLTQNAARWPDRAAISTPAQTITHAEIPGRVLQRAATLLALGLRTDAMTAVTIADEVEHLVTTLALMALGTRNIAIGSFEKSAARARIGAALDVAQTVTTADTAPQSGMGQVLILPDADPAPEGDPPHALRQRMMDTTVPLDEAVFYRSTSGTTGVPKTIGTLTRLMVLMAHNIATDPAKACVLRTSSVEYNSSRLHQVGMVMAGCTAAILDDFTAGSLARFCRQAGVTEIHTGTYKLALLLAAPPDPAHKLPDGVRILSGGSRVSGELRRAVRARLTPDLWVNYATSEVGVISIARPDDHDSWPEGVGRPDPGVEVVLRDAAGAEVPAGTPGEAWVRKPGVKGWVRTGDILSWPADGPLIFHARADDMMILNGINIFPAPIEDALVSHPDVAEAVAFAIPSRLHGQIPVAAVVLHPQGTATEAALVAHARAQLGVRGPRLVRIVDMIPRTALGKPKPSALGFTDPTAD